MACKLITVLTLLLASPAYPFQLGENLKVLLQGALNGCSIRTILRPNVSSHEETLVDLILISAYYYKSYLVEFYVTNPPTLLNSTSLGKVTALSEYKRPNWLLKRHTACYAHLYFIQFKIDIQNAIGFHFVDFDLRLSNPNYVLIWNLGASENDFREAFAEQEFHTTFMDYRIFITKVSLESMFEAGLICMVCLGHNQERDIEFAVNFRTKETVHSAWKDLHRDHFRREIFCLECQSPNNKYTAWKDSIQEFIAFNFNGTLETSSRRRYEIRAMMMYNIYLSPFTTDYYFLIRNYPSFVLSPAFWLSNEYKLMTIVHKSLFVSSGWWSFFEPFHKSLRITLALCLIGVYVLIIKITNHGNSRKHSWSLLALFGPLTDQWSLAPTHGNLKYIFFLWGITCYSITVLYGGELATSLSVLLPPPYPKHINELGVYNAQHLSVSPVAKNDRARSSFAEALEEKLGMIGIGNLEKSERFVKVANEIEKSFCGREDILSRDGKKTPYCCSTKPKSLRTDVPVTFVDHGYYTDSVRVAFESSPSFWVSSTSHGSDMNERFPMILRKNYFAKLVMPVISMWMASGLESYMVKLRDRYQIRTLIFDDKIIPEYDDLMSSRILEFSPVKLSSLVYVLILLIGVLTLAGSVFLIETTVFKGYCSQCSQMLTVLAKIMSAKPTPVQVFVMSYL